MIGCGNHFCRRVIPAFLYILVMCLVFRCLIVLTAEESYFINANDHSAPFIVLSLDKNKPIGQVRTSE